MVDCALAILQVCRNLTIPHMRTKCDARHAPFHFHVISFSAKSVLLCFSVECQNRHNSDTKEMNKTARSHWDTTPRHPQDDESVSHEHAHVTAVIAGVVVNGHILIGEVDELDEFDIEDDVQTV